jgi:type IV secretory pathway ATPase VirB11/archaellum biosynthesis ATPase
MEGLGQDNLENITIPDVLLCSLDHVQKSTLVEAGRGREVNNFLPAMQSGGTGLSERLMEGIEASDCVGEVTTSGALVAMNKRYQNHLRGVVVNRDKIFHQRKKEGRYIVG